VNSVSSFRASSSARLALEHIAKDVITDEGTQSSNDHGNLLLHAGTQFFGSAELNPHLLSNSLTTVLLFHRNGLYGISCDWMSSNAF
jgi:hypothetical protein